MKLDLITNKAKKQGEVNPNPETVIAQNCCYLSVAGFKTKNYDTKNIEINQRTNRIRLKIMS